MTDLGPELREKLALAVHEATRCNCDSGDGDRMIADALAPLIAGWMSDARTELLHPEFGSEWQEDGELRKAYEDGVQAGKRQAYRDVLEEFERPPVWGPNENGDMMLDMSLEDFLADLRAVVFGRESHGRSPRS